MSEELKPCPFCGDDGKLLLDADNCPFASCETCSFEMPAYRPGFEHMAIAAWNRRANELEPESVPIPTTVNMARMMLGLGYNYLENHAPEHLAASTIPASEARELPPLIEWKDGSHDYVMGYNEAIEACRAALASTRTASDTRTAAGEAEWGAVHTVGDMVRNLLTLDQSDPIYAAFHVDYEGERRCRTRPVSISRERVIDGKWVDPARKDVPYNVIVWAKQDERTDAASTDAATRCRAEGGNTCATCNDSGIVGRAPDDYYDCPDCLAARTQADAGKDAERYRWLLKQIPCNIADALKCGLHEISDEIDAMLSASAAHSAEGE